MLTIPDPFSESNIQSRALHVRHNGSIWPHDITLIALGFSRYGCIWQGLAMPVRGRDLEMRGLPELFCGFQPRRGRGPTLYPVACLPQWAAGTPFLLLRAALRLTFDPARSEICLHNPYLPLFLDNVLVRNVRLGDASVDLAVHRDRDAVSVETVRTQGVIRVCVIYDNRRIS